MVSSVLRYSACKRQRRAPADGEVRAFLLAFGDSPIYRWKLTETSQTGLKRSCSDPVAPTFVVVQCALRL
jgi:hypothetical protein